VTAAAVSTERPNLLGVLLELTKFRISAASAFTAAMGYLAARRGADLGMFTALLGTVLLAMAASALNEVQERELDARMTRTRHRPIPSGQVSAIQATVFAIFLGLSGHAVLVLFHGWTAGLLGLLALGWYNGLYTPLKRRSAFAVVPGSVIGALPPAIGWAAAGGNLRDPAILALCFVFFVWQVPHFWLLALRHREGYAQAGFPTLSDHFTETQIRRLIFTWTCATLASCALLPAFRTTTGVSALVILGVTGLWLLYRFSLLLRRPQGHGQLLRAFLDINIFALAVMTAVIGDALGAW
jgi:protoheme IX farnesyltransferase